MKRVISMLLCNVMLAAFSACSSGENASVPDTSTIPNAESSLSSEIPSSAPTSESQSSEQGLEVDKGLLDVTINFPASMFQDGISDDDIKSAKADGIDVTKNADGSVTYKMSKATHKKLMDEYKKSTQEALDKLKTSGDYESIKDVKSNDDFSQITISVDKAKYQDSMDAFAALSAGFQGMFYQIFDGRDANSTSVKVSFVDANSGGEIDSVTYPDALQESSPSK